MTQLPANITRVLEDFLAAAKQAFGPALESAVLFGSAAEGRLRASSDVNLILVVSAFTAAAAAAIEKPLRFAETAIRLRVMILPSCDIPAAASAFAQKFSDIAVRRTLLFGSDPFAAMTVPREALRAQVEQVLLNLAIRLRERAASEWSREDLLARAVSDAVGPVRACAQSLASLHGRPAASPKAALADLLAQPGAPHGHLAEYYSNLREQSPAPKEAPGAALIETIELIDWMRGRNA